jgi:hypothetical protein
LSFATLQTYDENEDALDMLEVSQRAEPGIMMKTGQFRC